MIDKTKSERFIMILKGLGMAAYPDTIYLIVTRESVE